MSQYGFGSGSIFAVRTDPAGVQTPIKLGVLQEGSVDTSFNTKALYGSNQFPVAVRRGQGKVSGKAKFAQINGRIWNDVFFGVTTTAGQTKVTENETGSIPTTPFAITVANSATFVSDLGVLNATTGLPMVKVATGDTPTTGQYKCAAGVYTFAAADTGVAVLISYTYTVPAVGTSAVVTNQALGTTPTATVTLLVIDGNTGKQLVMVLHCVVFSKFSIGTKMEDYVVPDLEFEAFANAAGNVLSWFTAE